MTDSLPKKLKIQKKKTHRIALTTADKHAHHNLQRIKTPTQPNLYTQHRTTVLAYTAPLAVTYLPYQTKTTHTLP